MQGFSGGPSTPIEQVSELGDTIIQKLVAAGITTVEGLADMTPEQLEEIPGIGEKTLERISVAVRHYFGQYEEGETNPNAAAASSEETSSDEESPSEEAKAVEEDEPGTPDQPVEEATAELEPHAEAGHENDDAATETMEVENAADLERTHPVEAEDVVHAEHPVNAEAVLQETEMAEEAAIDSGEGQGGV